MSRLFLFVGEHPSPTARRMGVSWRDWRLCAKTLRDALVAAGLDPEVHGYTNAYTAEGEPYADALRDVLDAHAAGVTIVGMGAAAQRQLRALGVPHLRLTHPAARGAIRQTERYRAHVAAVLGPVLQEAGRG